MDEIYYISRGVRLVFDRFKKKKRRRSRKSLDKELVKLKAEESLLDFEKSLEETRKRVAQKKRSGSTLNKMGKETLNIAGSLGRGIVSAADTVFGGPPPPPPKKSRRKKKKDDDFFPFI